MFQQPEPKPQPITSSTVLGIPTPRIDGPLKTTGTATYTSDVHLPNLVFAWPATATIASGKILTLDTSAAERMPGVLAVYTHKNIPPIYRTPPAQGFSMMQDERRPPLEDDTVRYWGQYVAVAVAQTVETARAAAESIKITYAPLPHNTEVKLLGTPLTTPALKPNNKRGDPAAAFKNAPVQVDALYSTPPSTHNPIELHASVADFRNGNFTLYETSQAVGNHRDVMAAVLGVPNENVQIITRFLGSGFGGKLWPWPHSLLAATCARALNRPVKLVVSRSMMFESVGHRPSIDQQIQLGATPAGKLLAIDHTYVNQTGILDDFDEGCGEATPVLYSCPNVVVNSGLARRNVGAPTAMRGPGAVPGLFALESAVDELALKLHLDPVQLRLLNEPTLDESNGLPFSSRHLTECLTQGAQKFGWSQRNPTPGSMKSPDGLTLGWGVAACTWIAFCAQAQVTVDLLQDNTVRVACGTQDIGTGTYTIFAQLVAHETGIPLDRINVVLGDSSLPPGPVSGGSGVTSTVTPAVLEASRNAAKTLTEIAVRTPNSPFFGKKSTDLELANGALQLKSQPTSAVPFGPILKQANIKAASANVNSHGNFAETSKFSFHSYGAHFVEVTWQPEIARLRPTRVVTVIDAGRMLNPRPARNQIEGAVVMGLGMALLEATEYDPLSGKTINNNLADYIVETCADAPQIDVTFLDYPDFHLNPAGARGVGEIGMAGVAAAVANAIHHATGLRHRTLPIRIEDLLAAPLNHA